MKRLLPLLPLLLLLLLALSAHAQMVPWTTRGGDQVHSGWNSNETVLTLQSVKTKGVTLQPPIPVIGDGRGIESQPLIDTGVSIGGASRDVMVLPSMADVVRGVDAHTGAGIWQTTLGMPLQGTTTEDIYLTNDKWGCEATGVIDHVTHRAYLPCQYSPDNSGDWATSRFAMFVLDLTNGNILAKVPFAGTMTVNGQGEPQDVNAQMRKLRASAVMLSYQGHNVVIECGGSVYMTRPGVTGFCSAFDTVSNTFTSFIATTQGRAGNVWMSGGAPAVMPEGSIIFVTATGGFDGTTQFAESAIRMTYDGQLHFVDHFTPYRDRVRTGQDAQSNLTSSAIAGTLSMTAGANPSTNNYGPPVNGHAMAMPTIKGARFETNVDPQGHAVTLVYPPIASGQWADEDLGSSQETCIAELDLCLIAGKDGIAYSVKEDNMGNTQLSDLANPKANCGKLWSYPEFVTSWTGKDPCPVNDEDLNFLVGQNANTVHQHFPPLQFYNPLIKEHEVCYSGENQPIKCYGVDPTTRALTFLAQTQTISSANLSNQPGGGMTGAGMCGSSNGDLEHGGDPNSAIMVATFPYGDSNKTVTNGRMEILDVLHPVNGIIPAIWDSQQWAIPFKFNKFTPCEIDGGEIIYPDFGGRVLIFQ